MQELIRALDLILVITGSFLLAVGVLQFTGAVDYTPSLFALPPFWKVVLGASMAIGNMRGGG